MSLLAEIITKFFTIRTLILALMVWLVLNPTLPQSVANITLRIEQTILRVSLHLQDLPLVNTDITVVHVPDIEYEQWQDDLPGASRLAQLFDNLFLADEEGAQQVEQEEDQDENNQQSVTVGMVLEQPFTLTQPESEYVLAEIQQGRRTKDHFFQEASTLLNRREKLINYLNSDSVVLGLYDRVASHYQIVSKKPSLLAEYHPSVVDFFWPRPPLVNPTLHSPVLNYSVIPPMKMELQHLLVRDDKHYFATFWVQFLLSTSNQPINAENLVVEADVSWLRHQGVSVDNRLIEAASDSGFVPLYGQLSGVRASLRQITLGAALAKETLTGWVLIGRDSSEQLENVAQVLASLNSDAYLIEPFWWPLVSKAVLLCLGLLVCFWLPLIKLRWLVVVTGMLLLVLSAMQLTGQILYNYWLPCGIFVLFYFVTLAGILIWRWQRLTWDRLQRRADYASLNLAESFIGTGNTQQALASTKGCRNSPELLNCLYLAAEQAEAQQNWPLAVEAWADLRRRKRRYKDVKNRLKIAKSTLVGEQTSHDNNSGYKQDLTQTMPLAARSEDNTLAKFGRYEVKQELGRGASGTVYLGHDPLISREVAIKVIQYKRFADDELADVKMRFFREAEAAGQLNHPSIVPVYDVGEEGGFAYIAMDYAKGDTLAMYTHPSNLLPVFTVYRIVLEVVEALAYAHNKKIVHRDIKPSNIVYSEDPFAVRVTDFGIARFVDRSQTQTGEIMGSPLYMSPEQVLGQKVGAASDLFSVGVMLYQLLTGCLPFSGESLATVSYDIVHNKHKGARSLRKELPASATRITNVCLQKKPSERYQSAEALAEALRKAIRRDFAAEARQVGFSIAL